jgi:radical SAM superfamily enzyme YgiQ (UPF0313 family)
VNAGHNLSIFELSAYLRQNITINVTAMDASMGDISWMDMARALYIGQFDVIAIMHDLGNSFESLRLLIEYCKNILPDARLIVFGRQVNKLPKFYRRYDLDAVVENGDYESGVSSFVRYITKISDQCPGIAIKTKEGWMDSSGNGLLLSSEDMILPDVKEIRHASYTKFYATDENKNCGIPERMELVVPISRGCPVGCEFCEVWKREGLRERRISVTRVINYITSSFSNMPFEYVSFYAPTFTLRKDWVNELSTELIKIGSPYPWKCTTALPFLDEDIIRLMSESGCVRISVGLETLGEGQKNLPIPKQIAEARFREVASWCSKYHVELNCFVILGLPGETIDDAENTAKIVRDVGARYRPTTYESNVKYTSDITEEDILLNAQRRFIEGYSKEEISRFNKLLFEEKNPTIISKKIKKRTGDKVET